VTSPFAPGMAARLDTLLGQDEIVALRGVQHQNHRGRPKLAWRPRAALKKAARAHEALEWIFDAEADGIFCFQNICDVLRIDAERLRKRIRGQSAEKRAA
jgi:hypothetical protein